MEKKKYSSYADIENDLEILKLERQISYQKLVLNIQKTKDSITPENIISGFLEPYRIKMPNSVSTIIKVISPYVINYFLNRKRGN